MIEAILLGIIQGITEFLPISSSAHLIIVPWFFQWEGVVNTLSFDIALHTGTLLALLIYFKQDWIELIRSAFSGNRILWYILIATIPAGLAGIILHDWVETHRSPLLIVVTLSTVSVLMIISERGYTDTSRTGLGEITLGRALIIGTAQALALFPGVSRSGITIVAGLMSGMKRHEAARFSFLLGTPVIAGASLLEAGKLMHTGIEDPMIFLIGIVVSATSGYLAIKYLIRFLQRHTLRPFAYYRFLLAFVIILSIWTGLTG
jgi:undecaprenyl-diphosphatase